MADYPQHLIRNLVLRDGTPIVIRPIRPDDAQREQAFVRELSEQSRYMRFMTTINQLPPKKLAFFTDVDYQRHLALLATIVRDGQEVQIGVARYVADKTPGECEFAVVVADAWQAKGVASRLMRALIEAARDNGYTLIEGLVFATNQKMLELSRGLGFEVQAIPGEGETVRVVRQLSAPLPAPQAA
jgi:acetyltransferase